MILDHFSKFESCRLLVVGDLMVDQYLWGEVDRISPEAPVQVVSVTAEDSTLGGGGNVINNLVSLGGAVHALGVVGEDANGRLLIEKLKSMEVDITGVWIEPGRPTTVKTRVIAAHQHVLRIDRETNRDISEASFKKLSHAIEGLIPQVDGVLISDYGKGLLTDEFLKAVLNAARRSRKFTVVDPKGTDYQRYNGASLITPNKKEVASASGVSVVDVPSLYRAGAAVLEKTTIERMIVTLGKDGMILFERGQEPFRITADARQVFDVSGAGDTVVAVLGLVLAAGGSLREAMTLANTAAGIVVGKVGTATVTRDELAAAMVPVLEDTARKQVGFSELDRLARELHKKGRRIVLTNGCFDLLHAGHIAFLSAAKKLGDVLIVAIDDDAAVRRLKGPGRPVIRVRERLRVLSALDVVDHVVVFSGGQLPKLVEALKPDVLTKGSNYSNKAITGQDIVEQLGGRVVLIPVIEDVSSTGIINQIRQR